ncbi:MAG TPA: SusC/RagA family TonB-linked outer membrane protein [Gemmatimonadaceae bacterium]|nr:SusC/RagA family TonB-linked outer membrane protein [Gemmatimonadaceae bacterium]
MNVRRSAFIAAALVLAGLASPLVRTVSAQGTITGRVTATEGGRPLVGAHVLLVGTTAVATTGEDGSYTIRNAATGSAQLQALHVGFESQKRPVTVTKGDTVRMDFALKTAVVQLQEVVTTATGQQRRVELGNAVSTVNIAQQVEERPNNNLANMLIAKSPSVTILPSTELGGAPTVRIRGVSSISLTNAPIYYVDGVRYSAGNLTSGTDVRFSLLNTLNPDEIEDIEIVKGPSAATLYGTNAANGVVLITTKKGRAGQTRWNWTAEHRTIDDRTPYQDMYANFGHNVFTGAVTRCQLATMITSANPANEAKGVTCQSDSLTHYNWLKDPDNTFVHLGRGTLFGGNVTGGTDLVRFFASGELDNEIGPIQMPAYEVQRFEAGHVGVRDEWFHPSAQQRGSFRGNLTAALTPKFDLNLNTGFSKLDNRVPPESDLIIALYYVGMQNYGYKGCPGGVAPCGLDKDPNQSDGTPLHDALQWAPGDIMQVTQNSDVQRFTGSANGNWRPFPWMRNDGTVGVDLSAVDFFSLCRLNECPPQTSTARLGSVTDNQYRFRNFSAKISSTSTYNFRSWMNFQTSVGSDYTNVEIDSVKTNGTILPAGASSVGAASIRDASNTQPTAVKTLGLYVQEQVGINDRLFLTAAVRTDQNSAFGTNFQQVYYPKASLSWLVSDESFFPRLDWLDQFRVRTAYGASGVQPGALDALALYTAANVSIENRSGTPSDSPGLTANQIANPDLKPETSREFEAGFDSDLLHRRLHFEYTFWNKKTKDALIQVLLSPSSTAPKLNPLRNIGSTQGWGHEVQLTAQLFQSRRFGWDVTLTGSHFSNKVVDLGIDPTTDSSRVLNVASGGTGGQVLEKVGYPINSQWFHPYTYADANGDGILQVNEVHVDPSFQYFGYRVPRDIFSVQNGFGLFDGALRLSAQFDYKGGASILDGANNFQCNTGPFACRDTQDPSAPLDRQAAAIAKRFGTTIAGTSYKSSLGYFRNNQFWKFRDFSAVWQLPNAALSRIRAQQGSSLVFSVRNIHTWSSWTGIDPEANYGTTQSESQNEFQTAGAPTYFVFRLNLRY